MRCCTGGHSGHLRERWAGDAHYSRYAVGRSAQLSASQRARERRVTSPVNDHSLGVGCNGLDGAAIQPYSRILAVLRCGEPLAILNIRCPFPTRAHRTVPLRPANSALNHHVPLKVSPGPSQRSIDHRQLSNALQQSSASQPSIRKTVRPVSGYDPPRM